MTSQQLPERPNLEQLKNQAKTLLREAQKKDPAALARFNALPAFSKRSAEEFASIASSLALHDAQSVIARAYGFSSWNSLREHVEERTLTFAAAIDEFVRCATGGASGRARRLFALHPGIAHANLYTELVLGDAAAIETRLKEDPRLATQSGGVQDWEPLLYLCHTCVCGDDGPGRAEGLVSIAHALLDRGANPNAEYHWKWHPELPRTALWGALFGTCHRPLARALLARGANPTDGVSMHIAAGSGHLDILDLLHHYGANVNGIPGGVPPLVYIHNWAAKADGIRWLLEHGADANLPWQQTGESPIHVAARRWNVAHVELLVQHGADVNRRRATDGITAHTIAELHGNHAIAEWLLAHGAHDELSTLQRFIAACSRGDRASAENMLRETPGLRGELRPEHHAMLHRPAESGDAAVLETMLACGFDPRVPDTDGVTPLHRASHHGNVDAVRALLAHGAPVDALDGMFSGTPLLWAAEGWSNHRDRESEFVAVARELINAGSPLEWHPPENTPGPERVQEVLAELTRAARRPD